MNEPTPKAPLGALTEEEITRKRQIARAAFADLSNGDAWEALQKEFYPDEIERIFATLDQTRVELAAQTERVDKAERAMHFAQQRCLELDEANRQKDKRIRDLEAERADFLKALWLVLDERGFWGRKGGLILEMAQTDIECLEGEEDTINAARLLCDAVGYRWDTEATLAQVEVEVEAGAKAVNGARAVLVGDDG